MIKLKNILLEGKTYNLKQLQKYSFKEGQQVWVPELKAPQDVGSVTHKQVPTFGKKYDTKIPYSLWEYLDKFENKFGKSNWSIEKGKMPGLYIAPVDNKKYFKWLDNQIKDFDCKPKQKSMSYGYRDNMGNRLCKWS